jgi:hypothetical protein
MPNDFYAVTGSPGTSSFGASAVIRAEFVAIQSAFDKLPSLIGNAGKFLAVNPGETALIAVAVTGSGSIVLAAGSTLDSPILITPQLGTPVSGNLVNAVGLPIATGVSGLGAGIATFLGAPSSANLLSAVSDETGSGALVFANSPTLIAPVLGTPASGNLVNCTGFPAMAVGSITGLGTGVATALAINTGTAGSHVVQGGALGTPSSGVGTNITGLPVSTGITGLGTGVATALAVNVGTAGSFLTAAAPNRNFIDNGAMMIDQRFAGAVQIIAVNSNSLDRWIALSDVTSKYSIQRVVDAPAGFLYSVKFTVLAQYSPGVAERFVCEQSMEGPDAIPLALGIAGAATVTISFWAKASVVGIYSFNICNGANSRSYTFTQTLTTAFVRYSKTIVLDTTGTWLTAIGTTGLRLGIDLGSGANFTGTADVWTAGQLRSATGALKFVNQVAGSTLNITGVQLELGTVATSFEHRPFQQEFARVQRHFCKSFAYATAPAQNVGPGTGEHVFTAGRAGALALLSNSVYFPVTMASAPTITLYNASAANAQARNTTTATDCTASSGTFITDHSFLVSATGPVGGLVGDFITVHWTASTGF